MDLENNKVIPVREGDELQVDITSVGVQGDGIAKVEGYTLFISDTAIGDQITIRITKTMPRYGFAEKIE